MMSQTRNSLTKRDQKQEVEGTKNEGILAHLDEVRKDLNDAIQQNGVTNREMLTEEIKKIHAIFEEKVTPKLQELTTGLDSCRDQLAQKEVKIARMGM